MCGILVNLLTDVYTVQTKEKFSFCKQQVENMMEKESASGTEIDIPCLYKIMFFLLTQLFTCTGQEVKFL